MIHQMDPKGPSYPLHSGSWLRLHLWRAQKDKKTKHDETSPPTHPQHPAANPTAATSTAHHGTTSNSQTPVLVFGGRTTKREPKHRRMFVGKQEHIESQRLKHVNIYIYMHVYSPGGDELVIMYRYYSNAVKVECYPFDPTPFKDVGSDLNLKSFILQTYSDIWNIFR